MMIQKENDKLQIYEISAEQGLEITEDSLNGSTLKEWESREANFVQKLKSACETKVEDSDLLVLNTTLETIASEQYKAEENTRAAYAAEKIIIQQMFDKRLLDWQRFAEENAKVDRDLNLDLTKSVANFNQQRAEAIDSIGIQGFDPNDLVSLLEETQNKVPVWGDEPPEDAEGMLVAAGMVFSSSITIANKCCGAMTFMDACHFKDRRTGNDKGKMVLAVAKDSRKKLWLLGSVYCYTENAANLAFLVNLLARANRIINERGHILMTDRSKAAFKMQHEVLPAARHHLCEEHLIRNIRKNVPGSKGIDATSTPLIRSAFRAYTKIGHSRAMHALQEDYPRVHRYLKNIPVTTWAAYTFIEDGVATYAEANNNPAESMANAIKGVRTATSYVEAFADLAKEVAEKMASEQLVLKKMLDASPDSIILPEIWTAYLNNVTGGVSTLSVECHDHNNGFYCVTPAPSISSRGAGLSVNTQLQTCECGEWQAMRRPCVHAFAVAQFAKIPGAKVQLEWWSSIYHSASYRSGFDRSIVVPSLHQIVAQDSAFSIPVDSKKTRRLDVLLKKRESFRKGRNATELSSTFQHNTISIPLHRLHLHQNTHVSDPSI